MEHHSRGAARMISVTVGGLLVTALFLESFSSDGARGSEVVALRLSLFLLSSLVLHIFVHISFYFVFPP